MLVERLFGVGILFVGVGCSPNNTASSSNSGGPNGGVQTATGSGDHNGSGATSTAGTVSASSSTGGAGTGGTRGGWSSTGGATASGGATSAAGSTGTQPFGANGYYSAAHESVRQQVNTYVKSGGVRWLHRFRRRTDGRRESTQVADGLCHMGANGRTASWSGRIPKDGRIGGSRVVHQVADAR